MRFPGPPREEAADSRFSSSSSQPSWEGQLKISTHQRHQLTLLYANGTPTDLRFDESATSQDSAEAYLFAHGIRDKTLLRRWSKRWVEQERDRRKFNRILYQW
jgi:hypothetical protein